MEKEMRQLRAKLASMETTQKRELKTGDVNEAENEYV